MARLLAAARHPIAAIKALRGRGAAKNKAQDQELRDRMVDLCGYVPVPRVSE